MLAIKPWYKVVTPREDLREGRPLDAAEFAVHLNHVRDGRGGEDYQDPARFFARTFLTKHLTGLASEVIRRLSGETTETSAVFNMATQFGGGKTHALTLHYPQRERTSSSDQAWARAGSTHNGCLYFPRYISHISISNLKFHRESFSSVP
jgi:predicted AAA+ superfamily ATPase